MSIRKLRTLVAIADSGSFRAAADIVHVSHAAVSQQMKALEDDWQLNLFDRSKHRPVLNAKGQIAVEKAREALAKYEAIQSEISSEIGLKGRFVLGAVRTTQSGLMPPVLGLLREQHPDFSVYVVPGSANELLEQAERGSIDAVLMAKPWVVGQHLEWRFIANENITLITSPTILSDDPSTILKQNRFIRFFGKGIFHDHVENWLSSKKIRVTTCMELDSLEAISSMVERDLGVSIVPIGCASKAISPILKQISLGEGLSHRAIGLISRVDSNKRLGVDAVWTALQSIAKNDNT